MMRTQKIDFPTQQVACVFPKSLPIWVQHFQNCT